MSEVNKMCSEQVQQLHAFDTELCADCVAWCPAAGRENLLVCTTYQLTPQATKVGAILLFSATSESLQLCHKVVDLPGVLDAKWTPKNYPMLALVVADSMGDVTFYTLESESDRLVKTASIKVFQDTPSPLALYVDWSCHNTDTLTATFSNGFVSLLDFGKGSISCTKKWEAHKFEAWVSSFDQNRPNILYTGGDDSVMKCFDIRTDPAGQVWKNTTHTAGVTSFLTNTSRPLHFASGSYDEKLLLWDSRVLRPREPLAEVGLGGGVWRVSARESNCRTETDCISLIAACMFAGFKTLSWTTSEFSIVSSYRENEECLAYGIDWSKNSNLFAACSFYDHKLTICLSGIEHVESVL